MIYQIEIFAVTLIYIPGKASAQRITQTCSHGNESRYSWKAEGFDVSQNLYSKTRKREVCRIE